MNNGTVKSTAFSGKGPVGVNSFGINQNAFAGVDDDILAIYVILLPRHRGIPDLHASDREQNSAG